MNLTDVTNNWFWASEVFPIDREHTTAIQFSSNKLEEYKKHGIELHYELHYADGGDNFVRICCHVFPYSKFANSKTTEQYEANVRQHYADAQAQKILDFRKALKEKYLEKNNRQYTQLEFGKKLDVDYVGLVKMPLLAVCNETELIAKVAEFISLTYPTLCLHLKDLGPILK